MKVLFIINTKSGNQGSSGLESMISAESRKNGFEFLIYRLEKNAEEHIKSEISDFSPDIVAVAGGDGTVNLMSKILCNTSLPLLIIPAGSANGMAKELGIGNRIDYAFSLIQNGVKRKIDLLKINNIHCIHLADVGLNARIVKRFEDDVKRGMLTYAKHLLAEIFLIKQYRFHIVSDGHEFTRKAVSLTFANASKYGTGVVINPVGKLDDGKFELVIIKPFPRVKLLSIAWKMLRGNLHSSEYAEVLPSSKAVIRTSKKTTLQIDGEVIGKTRLIEIEILPGALTVIVPPLSEQ
ncbi:diacylglycerol/lipid kinase family protein [Arcticibacter tournemirensis]|uniref:Diacylglycerol kinase family lipid kinase n=1 Tax=Arcticibacter tournemirensis TaxID=699437 RepID=A0A4Q0MH63_9SPHI|nr:diacylglycerol kinase family protein [Arcticibacter tournemirensis]RXF72349.1 diacylglycerol kinase family lipid kinase [Arcticibacter tournemirensis]